MSTYDAKPCPTCGQPVQPNRIGRPRVFCSNECRHEMARVRDELPVLERELGDARMKERSDYWPGARFWGIEAHRLELAVALARSRVIEAHS